MSRSNYPRLGETRNIQQKQARRPAVHKKHCLVCGAEATHGVFIEVSFMRGDDEGPVHACKEHKETQALLDAWINAPIATSKESKHG